MGRLERSHKVIQAQQGSSIKRDNRTSRTCSSIASCAAALWVVIVLYINPPAILQQCNSIGASATNVEGRISAYDYDSSSAKSFLLASEGENSAEGVYPDLYPSSDAKLVIRPTYGQHSANKDSIFAVGTGFGADVYIRFVTSLVEANYTGDIVLGVSARGLSHELQEYFAYHATHHSLVVYEIPLRCYGPRGQEMCRVDGMFAKPPEGHQDDASAGRAAPIILEDPRALREVAQVRYEYYWAWSTFYEESSRIWMLDCRDVHFQKHPFTLLPTVADRFDTTMKHTLHVYEEASLITLGEEKFNRDWIEAAYGKAWVTRLQSNTILCSGSTMGGQPAVNLYTRAMVHAWDDTQCPLRGCDQGHHNFLVGSGRLLQSRDGSIKHIVSHKQGEGTVNTMSVLLSRVGANLTAAGILDTQTNQVLNKDGSVSPIIHQFDRHNGLKQIVKTEGQRMMAEWEQRKPKVLVHTAQ
jgi:hypothetical protein